MAIHIFSPKIGEIVSFCLTSDEKSMIICGAKDRCKMSKILLHELAIDNTLASWKQSFEITDCACSPDGRYFAVSTLSGYVVINALDREAIVVQQTLNAVFAPLARISISGDSKRIYTCSSLTPNFFILQVP